MSADREWVGKRESDRRKKERRETLAPDTLTQFETELMNEQAKGPGDDRTVRPRRPSSPTLDTDTCCGQGMWGETLGEKLMNFTKTWWPAPTHRGTTKHQAPISDKVRLKILHTETYTHIQLLCFLWTHVEKGREDYSNPHDDGLKNRPFIRHRSTITQCTRHFHAVIHMASSTWLPGSESAVLVGARH